MTQFGGGGIASRVNVVFNDLGGDICYLAVADNNIKPRLDHQLSLTTE